MKIDEPIFIQVAQWIKNEILTEHIKEREKIPSTNWFANMYGINPATARKGISLLVKEGLLYKKRGIGMFVVEGAKEKIARTLLWSGRINRPLYSRKVQCIDLEDKNSFIREYNFKLSKLYDAFFTQRAKEIAAERKIIAELCYKALVEEVETSYGGASHLEKLLVG